MAASDRRSYTMAGEAAAEILSQKLEMLLHDPVQVSCLLTEKPVKDAKEKLATIQAFLSSQDRSPEGTEWLARLLRAMYDAEEFIDKFHLRETHGRHEALHVATRPAAALVSKFKLWRDLSKLVDTLQELCQDQYLTGKEEAEGNTEKVPAGSSSPASVPWPGQKLARLTSLSYRQTSNFLWCENEKKEILNLIKSWSWGVNGTSILGEQGTGKTFLARWVYREAMYLGVKSRAWVHMSASMDTKEFLYEILKQIGKPAREVKEINLNEITVMLHNELDKTKKFLVVLDDVQPSNVRLLQRLVGIILFHPQGHIITTTQDDRIAKSMNFSGAGPIKLKKLDYDKSQKMLASKLHRVPDGQSLSKGEDILNTCRGLPLSLCLLGGLLSYAKEAERVKLVKDCSTLPDILQLSFHRLPVHLKPCFIYMALFPVASPIPTRRLVRLWLAEGLLDSHCYNRERKPTRLPEDVGETFIMELSDRNLIDVVSWRADGSPKACQMLTSLYDMISPIAMSMGLLHIHATSKSKDKNDRDPTGQQQQAQPQETKVRWLAEHTNIVRDGQGGRNPSLNLGHVRSFLSFYLRRGMLTKDINMVLGNMTSRTDYSLLRVLDLEGVYKPSLQGVLHKLVLLKYLGLRSTVLDSIPSAVADLYYLETLDIKYTNITSLPSSLWKARNLRHLHLNWFYTDLKNILKACNDVKALTKLQTLSGLVISEVKGNWMTDHMNSLTTLTTLKLFLQHSGGDNLGATWVTVANWISFRLTNLQSLTLGVIQGDKPATSIGPIPELSLDEHRDLLELYLLGQLNKPIWTQLLPGSLRVLTLSGSKVEADMVPQLGNLLINLRTFKLLANSFLGTHMTFAKDGFPSLMILKIWKLPKLGKLTIEKGAMLRLKELEFRHLDTMEIVDGIDECEELETICVVVKKGNLAFVDRLEKGKRESTNLYKIEETKTPKPTDDDDSRDEDETKAEATAEDETKAEATAEGASA